MNPTELLTNAGAALIGDGRYSVLINDSGTGHSSYDAFAITRWRGDWINDSDGFLIYLRDLATGSFCNLSRSPASTAIGGFTTVKCNHSEGHYLGRLGTLEVNLHVQVPTGHDAELRRVRLTNHDTQACHIELTSYVELALNYHSADAAHPGFSKLFVQTEQRDGRLMAKRRPRSPGESSPWVVHTLLDATPAQYETDRAKFIGRGRHLGTPDALTRQTPLTNTVGNVLDPILSLRTVIVLAPGASQDCTLVLAAGPDRASALRAVQGVAQVAGTDLADTTQGSSKPPRSDLPPHLSAYLLGRTTVQSLKRRTEAFTPPTADPLPAKHYPAAGLQFDNTYGGFGIGGHEYVVRVSTDRPGHLRLPPMPWINTIANERIGFLVSETGAGYTWSRNSREHRLTPWNNDPISDPHGEAMWLRDRDSNCCWSPLPGPLSNGGDYDVTHGFGYTNFETHSHELQQSLCMFVPRHDPVKIARIKLHNRSDKQKRLSFYCIQSLVLGVLAETTQSHIRTSHLVHCDTLTAVNAEPGDFTGAHAFCAVVSPSAEMRSCTTERSRFFGRDSELQRPAAVIDGLILDGFHGKPASPCFAWQVDFIVPAQAEYELHVLFGETQADDIEPLISRYQEPDAIEAALAEVRQFWRMTVGALKVSTPSPAIDLMLNGWLLYQVLSCRIWGRSAFYQSGGAFGFRDQLQDSVAFIHTDPQRTREQILLHAAHQFQEGDVLHWWHPPASRGIRTRFSDDLLWLPLFTAYYIEVTGDWAILDEQIRFLKAPLLAPGEDETFLLPEDSGETADLYEHCVRSLDRSLTRGAHGLPLMGTGDWNDGMNRVGREGRGESVWVGFFLHDIIRRFLPICAARGDMHRHATYNAYRDQLGRTLNETGWDGNWYRRAYYDDGTPLGSAGNDECQIDALAQSWSVISGVAPAARAQQAMDAVERHLVSESDGLIRLLTPPFDQTPHDAGYIKGYIPGIRENGGQYTHGALWVVQAMALLGRNNRAAKLLEMLSPVTHATTAAQVAVYQVEPYVVAADVYGTAPHIGRGGWTWYTGSAAWMYRIAIESILGLRVIAGKELEIAPCIPDEWPGYTVNYTLPQCDTHYLIDVSRIQMPETARTLTLDGKAIQMTDHRAVVPLIRDSRTHKVTFQM